MNSTLIECQPRRSGREREGATWNIWRIRLPETFQGAQSAGRKEGKEMSRSREGCEQGSRGTRRHYGNPESRNCAVRANSPAGEGRKRESFGKYICSARKTYRDLIPRKVRAAHKIYSGIVWYICCNAMTSESFVLPSFFLAYAPL